MNKLKTLKEFKEDELYLKMMSQPEFLQTKHVKYYKMCLSLFPSRLQKEDSNKMALSYFSVLGLDMMNSMDVVYSNETQRQEIFAWLYSHYTGDGFRGSLTHKLEDNTYDPTHLPSTYFALCLLAMLHDTNMASKIDRVAIMRYLRRCQCDNGGFTAIIGANGAPFGESDLRMSLIACSIRELLQIGSIPSEKRASIDVDTIKLAQYIADCMQYNGGFGGDSTSEAHAGHTFCGLAALKLLGKVKLQDVDTSFAKTVEWLVKRQNWFTDFNKQDFEDNEYLSFEDSGGFNGRENKYSDTCYAFWVTGSLKVLGKEELINRSAMESFLLCNCQNKIVGGFGKGPDDMPDPLHSSLGIAALKTVGSEFVGELKALDECLVIPVDAATFIRDVWRK